MFFHINLAAGHFLVLADAHAFLRRNAAIGAGHAFLVLYARLPLFQAGRFAGRQPTGMNAMGNSLLLILLRGAPVLMFIVSGLRLRHANGKQECEGQEQNLFHKAICFLG